MPGEIKCQVSEERSFAKKKKKKYTHTFENPRSSHENDRKCTVIDCIVTIIDAWRMFHDKIKNLNL